MRKPVLALILIAAFSLAGCILPPECDPDSDDFDPETCDALLFLLTKYATEAAYGEWEPPPQPESSGGCVSLPCRGFPCRLVLNNGNFERKLGLGLEHFAGAIHTDQACLGEVGAKIFSVMYQWTPLQDALTPGELLDVSRMRVRARAWFNTASSTSKSGILRLVAAQGHSQEITLLTRETSLTTDADNSTWEPIELAMTLPADAEYVLFEVESTTDTLVIDYAQVAIDTGNRAPTAYDKTATIAEDTPWGFLPNALDPDGTINLLSLQTSQPEYGMLVGETYTPPPHFFGEDRFTYSIADDQGLYSNEATVTLRIIPINDVPEASDDAYPVSGGLLLVPAVVGVLANDSDADGDTLTAVLMDDVQNGTLSFEADGGFTYTPDAGFTGTDTFTYYASDGADSSFAAVSLSSEPTNYDLAIEKSANPTSVQPGRLVTFTVTVTNNGPADATGIRVRDRMTQFTFELDHSETSQGTFSFDIISARGTWNVGSLDAGERATLKIFGYPESSVTNTATIIDGLGPGDDDDNNEDRASVNV